MQRRGFLTWAGAAALGSAVLRPYGAASAQPPMCPTVYTHDAYLTPAGAHVPTDGGVLVGLTFDNTPPAVEIDVLLAYVFTQGTQSRHGAVTALAPGLSRITANGLVGAATLRGLAGERQVELDASRGTTPPAPHVTRIFGEPIESTFVPPGSANFYAEVREPVPAGVVAVIVYVAERPVPKCYALVRPGQRKLFLYRPRTHCDGSIPGESPVYPGAANRIAYVHGNGCVSNQSNHVIVVG